MEPSSQNISHSALMNASAVRREATNGRVRAVSPVPGVRTAQEESDGSEDAGSASDSESVLTLYLTHRESQEDPQEQRQDEEQEDAEVSEGPFALPEVGPRATTAPARPRTETENFKSSGSFLCLENAAIYAVQLIQRSDSKIDLDSNEGQKNCRRLLGQMENLCECFKVNCASRKYRSKFSQAYRVLYSEGALSYLTEILDSAQERKQNRGKDVGFPYLWVNGEKYMFTPKVLKAGEDLFVAFCRARQCVRTTYME